ncbi:hypothetical protein TI03_01450 [Achromatium sp. WMS1]|nr:hypothetical protein TI03_01450 [Achromatium sp. WMS1]
MLSISQLPGMQDVGGIAEQYDIPIEMTDLIFIGNYQDSKLEELKANKRCARYTSAHGPFFDLVPCTQDQELKKFILHRFQKAIRWCEYLGIYKIILHTGWMPKTYPDDIWLKNSVEFWSELLITINPDMQVFIENVYEDTPTSIKKLIDQIDSQQLKVCLDIGHVNANSTNSLELWLKGLGNRIGHLHIHNNNGLIDDHFGLIEGTISFPQTFELFSKYCPDASWNLEVKNHIQESIELAEKYICTL